MAVLLIYERANFIISMMEPESAPCLNAHLPKGFYYSTQVYAITCPVTHVSLREVKQHLRGTLHKHREKENQRCEVSKLQMWYPEPP